MWVGEGGCWDCAGQRRVTEQHTENGSIVSLSTLLDRSGGWLPFVKLLDSLHLEGVYINHFTFWPFICRT